MAEIPDPSPPSAGPTLRGEQRAADGTALAWARWDRPEPVGHVVILHGYGEHGGLYAHTAAWLNRLGWSVSTLDQRGFGRSGGPRGDSRGMAVFAEDFRHFLAVQRRPGLPLVVLAHSFGALVALVTLSRAPGLAEAAVLSSPSLVLRPLSWSVRAIRAVMLRLAPHLSLEMPSNKDLVCSDPARVERYWADPLCHRRMTAAYSLVFDEGRAMLRERAAALTLPMLVLEAGEDVLVDPDGAEDVWSRVPVGRLERRRLAGFRHEIFHDRRRAEAQALAGAWLAARFVPVGRAPGTPAPFEPCEDG